jgi:choline-sulfatase
MAPQQAAGDPDVPETWTPADVATYGFDRWDPPDAGENRDISQFGGGDADNDGRIMGSRGDGDDGEEGVLQYLRSVAPGRQPFFLVISLVNPHDVLAYPRIWQDGGYDSDPWLDGEIDLPPTVDEDLSTKPAAQRWFNTWLNLGLGPLRNAEEQRNYINFYGNLMKAADAALVEVPDTLDETGLLDDTLIVRTSDHGELGMAHGGMRQKSFNVYEESLRVEPAAYNALEIAERDGFSTDAELRQLAWPETPPTVLVKLQHTYPYDGEAALAAMSIGSVPSVS